MKEPVHQPANVVGRKQRCPTGHGAAGPSEGDGGDEAVAGFSGQGFVGQGWAEAAGHVQAVAGATILVQQVLQLGLALAVGSGQRAGGETKRRVVIKVAELCRSMTSS